MSSVPGGRESGYVFDVCIEGVVVLLFAWDAGRAGLSFALTLCICMCAVGVG